MNLENVLVYHQYKYYFCLVSSLDLIFEMHLKRHQVSANGIFTIEI